MNENEFQVKKVFPPVPYVRPLHKGMGEAVAARTVFRDSDKSKWENVATRVAEGNTSLVAEGDKDFAPLRDAIAAGRILMSGRHLQHGDKDQVSRNLEIMSNCSTAAASFILFYLLLNGSGVGRDYSDNMIIVDWDFSPALKLVCDKDHPDFTADVFQTVEKVKAETSKEDKLYTWFKVPDSREGWAQAAELYETMTFEKKVNEGLVLDFSDVRCKGQPIGGMQNRPASGPVPTANAFKSIADLKGKGYPKWKQAMFVDHYLAECVVVGGARRSARMSTKYWGDSDAIDFAHIKGEHGLWSSNNSIIATAEFYEQAKIAGTHASDVFKAMTHAAYHHGTGEPGVINVHNFAPDTPDWSIYEDSNYVGSFKYQVYESSKPLLKSLVSAAKNMPYHSITNPCVTADTWIQTSEGPKLVADLIDNSFKALVGNKAYKASGFFRTGEKDVFKIKTERGFSLRLTDNHQVLVRKENEDVWVEVKDLQIGDSLVIDNHRKTSWVGSGIYKNAAVEDGVKAGKQFIDVHVLVTGKARCSNINKLVLCDSIETASFNFYRGFLKTLLISFSTSNLEFDTANQNLAVESISIKISEVDLPMVQRMLARTGIVSSAVNANTLLISGDNVLGVELLLGTVTAHSKLKQDNFISKVSSITPDGFEPVYDCTVEEVHRFDANGLIIHNCGEISLNILGGYCVIADVVPYFADSIDQAEEAFCLAARALIRVNTMDSLYKREVERTNRIGVSFTGLHEFAWKFFNLGFRDLLDEDKAKPFWKTMARFSRAVKQEAVAYSKQLGVNVPATDTTVKPAGTTSKLFGLTEGAHLPSMKEYLRWVQYRTDANADQIQNFSSKGYPTKELKTYAGTTIVGFPTQPLICKLGMADKLVTAAEATPEEQYKYLSLLEKYWIRGVDEEDKLLEKDTGNQISYTLKYDPLKVSYEEFANMMLEHQSKIRCCSVMPSMDTTAYEYQPEEPFTSVKHFMQVIGNITDVEMLQDIDMEHLSCSSGACPI
jgi:hypothetical protein